MTNWKTALQEIAENRNDGAAVITSRALEYLLLAIEQNASRQELQDALKLLVRGQPAMASVLRVSAFLWNLIRADDYRTISSKLRQEINSHADLNTGFAESIKQDYNSLSGFSAWFFFSFSSSLREA